MRYAIGWVMNILVFHDAAKKPKTTWAKVLLLLVFGIYSYDSKAADLEAIFIDPRSPETDRSEDGTSATARSLSEAVSLYPTGTVTSIHFSRGRLSEDDVRLLNQFARLQFLDLHETNVRDETWKRLGTVKHLPRIGFYNCELSLATAQAIRSHSDIRTITLDICDLADGVTAELVASQSVQFLRITGSKIDVNWPGDTSWEPKVKELHLQQCGLCDAHIAAIGRLHTLEKLSLDGNCLSDAGLKPIGELKNLRSLSLRQIPHRNDKARGCENVCGIGDTICETIGSLSRLEELDLVHANVTPQGIKQLLRLKKLRTLNLMETPVGDEGVALLATLPELRSVNVSYPLQKVIRVHGLDNIISDDKVQITDRSLQTLSKLEHLEEVRLYQTQVSDEGLKSLRGMKTLRVLDLGGTKITPECFETLQTLTSLETLGFDGVQIDREKIMQLAESLPNCRIESVHVIKRRTSK